jgi:ubiquinone/menaquinone biosynthesis C-methylase UbiE
MHKNNIRKRYDELGGSLYDTRYTEEQAEKYEHISGHLDWGISLDNGCGTGLFLPKLGEYSVGLDLSSELLREARSRLGRQQNLVHGDSENLPFRNQVFDSSVSVTVIQNIPEPQKMIKESIRVTKPGLPVVISSLKRVYKEDAFRKLFQNDDLVVKTIYTSDKINDWIAVITKTP